MEWAAAVISRLGAHLPGFISPSSPNIGSNVGTALILRGVRCFIQPGSQYYEFGIPREGSDNRQPHSGGSISPLIYVKGIRELGYGVALVNLQRLHDEGGLRVLLWIGALMSLADGGVVLVFGRRNYQMVAFHLLFAVYLGAAWWIRTEDGCLKREVFDICTKAK
ncbi:hypothetical protein BDW71DRAFT_190599 [Aspergillus fruticulosus]